MTDLARSRSDQFIDRLGEFIEADSRPEPGYRRRPKPDWLSEFADERHGAPVQVALPDPPLSLELEPERAPRGTTNTGRLAALAPMILLAAVSAAIGLLTPIMRPADLPVVRRPVVGDAAPPPVAAAPLLAAVPRAPETSSSAPAPTPAPAPVREAERPAPRSLPVSGSTPREIETGAVQDVLERYRAAFGTLSTAGIEDFWPDADTPALARTFERLQSLRLEYHSCGVELSAGERATARCTGRATFVPKAGGRSERVESRVWSFGLSRVNDRWIIVSAESRQPTALR